MTAQQNRIDEARTFRTIYQTMTTAADPFASATSEFHRLDEAGAPLYRIGKAKKPVSEATLRMWLQGFARSGNESIEIGPALIPRPTSQKAKRNRKGDEDPGSASVRAIVREELARAIGPVAAKVERIAVAFVELVHLRAGDDPPEHDGDAEAGPHQPEDGHIKDEG